MSLGGIFVIVFFGGRARLIGPIGPISPITWRNWRGWWKVEVLGWSGCYLPSGAGFFSHEDTKGAKGFVG